MHFIALNLYSDEIVRENMLKWLKQDLKMANQTRNRVQYPWIIVYTSMPFYFSEFDSKAPDHNIFYYFEIILKKYKVDLVF